MFSLKGVVVTTNWWVAKVTLTPDCVLYFFSVDISEVFSMLAQAGALYEKCMATSDVKKVRTLQAYLYDFVGNTDERDRISELLGN